MQLRVYTSIMTGCYPFKHQLIDFATSKSTNCFHNRLYSLHSKKTRLCSLIDVLFDCKYRLKLDGLNMWLLFWLSLTSVVFYRVVSTYKVWDLTRPGDGETAHDEIQNEWCGANIWWRIYRCFLQLFDLEIFDILYSSHVLGIRGSSSPQRLLAVLEAILEAAPQVWSIFLHFKGMNKRHLFESRVSI